MNAAHYLALGLVCSIFSSGCAIFQNNPLNPRPPRAKMLAGPVTGLNRNYHTGGFRTIEDPLCPHFDAGSGNGYLVGLTAEILPNAFSRWSIIPRIVLEQRPGSFRQQLPDALVILPGAEDPVRQVVNASSDVTYTMLEAQLFYKYEFATVGKVRFGVAGGPVASLVLSGTNRQVQDLVEPTNARFVNSSAFPSENGGRRLLLYDGTIPEMLPFRLSMMGGVQGEIPLFGNQWYMTPGLYYDYGLTDVTKAENWQLNSIVFMVDFRHSF